MAKRISLFFSLALDFDSFTTGGIFSVMVKVTNLATAFRSYGIRRTGKGDSAAPLAKQGFGLRCAARTANEQ
jgi:hypothetical protein